MTNRIKILSDIVANKIAAGEVVQRPSSVVKELLENAIDASATKIDLVIRRAGKLLIQVIDNGMGMNKEDAVNCVKRHATSKISSIDDLDKLATLGFRGEALSSIAAVSQFELRTQTKNSELGTELKIFDNNYNVDSNIFDVGTNVSVKNLFYNVPARRKFLKSNSTELKHIIEAFKKIALSAPEISFKFWNDDDLIFDFPKGNFKKRIEQVIADNITDVVLEVDEVTDYITLKGFIAKPNFLKRSKSDQYLFVNGRAVVSKQINHAIFAAYEAILEKGDYPFFVLFLELDQSKIDINVHPQKLEIKFDNEKEIYSFVNSVIRKTLGSFDLVPGYKLSDLDMQGKTNLEPIKQEQFGSYSSEQLNYSKEKSTFIDDDVVDELFGNINSEIRTIANMDSQRDPFNEYTSAKISNSNSYQSSDSTRDSFIVSLHNKYILSQIRSGVMLIDQHVAHERILYEQAKKSIKSNIPFSQQLLFAQTIKVDPAQYELLEELNPHLLHLGFELKFFGDNTIVIDGVPDTVKIGLEADTLLQILDEYAENQKIKKLDAIENIAKSYACKTAIKAGDSLTEKEMRTLVDQLFATSNPYVCPHGRPIVIKIPLDELDKKFGRR